MRSPRCPTCERPFNRLWDVPWVTVERVQLRPLSQRPWPEPCVKLLARKPRDLTSAQQRIQLDLRRIIDDREAKRAQAIEITALDGLRDYMASLRKLSGRTVRWWTLLPPWQPKQRLGWYQTVQIPGSPREEHSSARWVVGLGITHWRGELRARLDVELVLHQREFGENCGTLASVWLLGHLNRAR